MATELPAPINVAEGPFSATATHEQFGATIQPWNDPGIVLYLTAVAVAGTKLTPINGVRSDNGLRSPQTAVLTYQETAALTGTPEWQAALAQAAELFHYIVGGRVPDSRPDWFP